MSVDQFLLWADRLCFILVVVWMVLANQALNRIERKLSEKVTDAK